MKPKINYHYTIPYKEVDSFDFIKYNPIVDETCYKERVFKYLPSIIEHLTVKPNSRQDVIMTHNNINYACLISLQFQIESNRLITIANFRSQCRINGRPYDTLMLQYFSTLVMRALHLKDFIIYCNVGNYHHNLTQ